MRKILFFLLLAGVSQSFAQTKSLVSVLTVKPKIGQQQNFEAAWIAHLKKFHQNDTTNRRGVFEIISGVRTGSYYITDGRLSWADMDVERSNDKAHDEDYSSTVSPTLESESGDYVYRWADTLSYNPNVQATKFVLTAYHAKTGKQDDVTDEIKRAIAVDKKINSPVSFNGYILTLSGSKPVVVIIRNLKEGFKEIDPDYNKGLSDKFKAAYIEMYGQPQWDKRATALADLTDLTEQEMLKYRQDLSSAQ
jgi:hypothetical protein